MTEEELSEGFEVEADKASEFSRHRELSNKEIRAIWSFLELLYRQGKITEAKYPVLKYPVLADWQQVSWVYSGDPADYPYHWGHVALGVQLQKMFPDEWTAIQAQQRLGLIPETF